MPAVLNPLYSKVTSLKPFRFENCSAWLQGLDEAVRRTT
jgi:hypothetical protein